MIFSWTFGVRAAGRRAIVGQPPLILDATRSGRIQFAQHRPLPTRRGFSCRTTTSIMVRPVDVHSSLVDVAAVLVRRVPATPELMQWLLRQNRELRFGMLSLSEEGEVGLSHSLVGDSLSSVELQVVLLAFVDSALRLRSAVGKAAGLGRSTARSRSRRRP